MFILGCFRYLLPRGTLVKWLNNLRCNRELLLDVKRTSIIILDSSIVAAGRDGDDLVSCELVHGVLRVLMRADDHTDLILEQELVHYIFTEAHYVALFVRVSQCVWEHSRHVVACARITPE